jgi:hypothetical protein
VEVLTSYSHTTQPLDLQLCANAPRSDAVLAAHRRPGSRGACKDASTSARADLIAAWGAGATVASLATAHDLSLRSVKRLLATAGARRDGRRDAEQGQDPDRRRHVRTPGSRPVWPS